MTRYIKSGFLIIVLIFPVLLGAMAQSEPEGKGPVSVGSKIDTEGALLGNLVVLVLERGGFSVTDKTELGTTDVVRKALETGEIDLYPEYTGNGAWFFTDGSPGREWYSREGALKAVREHDSREFGITWLEPAPANNTWAIAVRKDLAQTENLVTLEDLAAYVNRGGYLKLAGSEEFVSRPDTLPAFQDAYGFELSGDQLLVLSSGNTALTEKAAADGTDGVNAAMAYGTDGPLSALNLIVLEDSLGVQLVYEPAPRIRQDVLDAYPEIAELLDPVFSSLDLETLQTLNAKIAVEGIPARSVAEEWLKGQSL